jgi:alginate O-acetyltransferase complex protein AlgI
MVFSSVVFLLYFLPLFFLAYYSVGKRYKNYVILAASIFFYSWGAPKFVFVILASTIIDFHIVKHLYQSINTKHRKWLLALSIFINLGLLLYFKYANFFVENVNEVLLKLGIEEVAWTSIVLPIGISFYTFQTLTYSIDVYRKIHAPLDKVSDYLLYIMSFPQMIAGPIVRFNAIADQITTRSETIDDKLIGFYRFTIGLSKKVLIANMMGEQADLIINSDLNSLNAGSAWLGILAYTFQIYFDFSGYSDMAIGLGRMMGFTFPENFNSPYTSTSISEFWRRWHITLGSFMKDYLYIPLGGSKVNSKRRLYFNLWIVFLLSGLWHGASWNFVIWGVYHGTFLILDRIFLVKLFNRLGKFVSIPVTFLLVILGWIIFRIEEVSRIPLYLSKLFDIRTISFPEAIPGFYIILPIAFLFSFITTFKIGRRAEDFIFKRNTYNKPQYITFTALSLLFFVLSISLITSSGFNPFIYFRF